MVFSVLPLTQNYLAGDIGAVWHNFVPATLQVSRLPGFFVWGT